MSFRLLSYNIRYGGIGRAEAIAGVVNACAPDLVVLQEATDPDTVQRLAQLTGMAASGSSRRQSLGFLSRQPLEQVAWRHPRLSRHAFMEIAVRDLDLRVFGVHLSAVHAAWTERRRVYELKALLKSVAAHQHGFHVLVGDFNTLAPGELLNLGLLPWRLRPFVWLSGGRVRWRTIQTVLDAGYTDTFRASHPEDPGATVPAAQPHVRLDYAFVPRSFANRVAGCDVIRGHGAAAASDHLPLLLTLT